MTADGAAVAEAEYGERSKPFDSKRKKRAPRFNAGLTEDSGAATSGEKIEKEAPAARYRNLPKGDDLTSKLIRELSTPPYPDCPICFAPIHPAQPTYSCSPSIPISAATEDEGDRPTAKPAETAQCCWTTFHLKCIRAWAAKSVKDIEEAWRARGEERNGEWRCPGCQSKRTAVPASYW